MPSIAKVEPLTTARTLRGPFDYVLPEAFEGVAVGSLLVVPFGRRRVLGVVVDLAAESAVAPEKLAAPVEALELGVPAGLVRLAGWIADEYCSTPARALALVLPPGTGSGPSPRVRARTALAARLSPAGAAALLPVSAERLGSKQREVLQALDGAGGGVVRAASLPADHGTLRRLQRRGLIELTDESVRRRPAVTAVGAAATVDPPPPSEDQAAVLKTILSALQAPGSTATQRRFLLHGVTGSGKTEVYLRAAAAALDAGRSAIILVPEIALTPQIVGRFQARFGDTVAILHSQLSEGERYDEWRRLRSGEARVCVGPRSAVFAPLADLGLVVLDEEHDSSYKHEGDPRYDARRVAERRAEVSGAVLLAGSATPRPETYARYDRLELPRRVDGRALPPVCILDMRGAPGALHPRTADALAQVRRAEGKAIVLLNRRGWSNFLSCRSCGRAWECPECDVTLVLHRATGAVACHHCGHSEAAPSRCPDCGSTSVARHGAGTERLEEELHAALGGPGFPIFRLDSDVGGGRDRIGELLGAFQEAPAGVLVGTQMVAKGHDFPDVTLAVILDADATLRFPDFRAEERTFSLVAQLAGRAGRGPRGGQVLVQTMIPDAPAIVQAAQHEAGRFLDEELERRRILRYPPYTDLIRVVCGSAEQAAADAAAQAIAAGAAAPGATVLGPAPLFRLRGRHRSQLFVKAGDRAAAVAAVGEAVDVAARDPRHRGVTLSVDVDPQ